MKELKKAQMGIIAVLALMLVSIKRRLPTRELSSGITTLALAGIVLLVAAGGASAADCSNAIDGAGSCNCGDTVVGDYTFTHDMTCPAGHGLIIGADGITIDGAGYAIIGDRTTCPNCGEANPEAGYTGILNYNATLTRGHDDVVIKDLEIKNFCNGIVIKGFGAESFDTSADNNTIFGCSVHDNGDDATGKVTHGIHLWRATNTTVKDCAVYNNTGFYIAGCGTGGHGIRLYGNSDNCTVEECNIYNNTISGIFTKYQCDNCTIAYNKVTDNGVAGKKFTGGIRLMCMASNDWLVEKNNVTDITGPGIFVRGSNCLVRHNTVTGSVNATGEGGCRGNGIFIHGDATGTEIYNNTFCDNEFRDIHNAGGAVADSNTCDTSMGSGMSGACDWSCGTDNAYLRSAYFDFDGDGLYSKDPADCACTIAGGAKCACCNPGLFNETHRGILNSTSPAIVWLVPGTDNHDSLYGLALPDLVITEKHENWLVPGSTYNITYTIKNQGGEKAGMSDTGVYINGVYNTSDPVGELNPGQSDTRTIAGPFALSLGGYDDISLLADNNTAVTESDENNNWKNNTLSAVKIYVDPPLTNVAPQDQFDINITINPGGVSIYGVEYYLTYNTSIVRAESQVKGPFLGTTSETIVVVNEIDRTNGIVSYAETRKVSGGVTEKNISSVIQFTAIGPADTCTDLHLYGEIIVKLDGTEVTGIVEDGEICIILNDPPTAIGCSKHKHNNAQKKFECLAQLCSNSTDINGDDIVYIRWSFGDGEYGTSEGLGDYPCKFHSYTSWIWEPFGDPNGRYEPFNASLTVTDNGDPQLEDTTYIDVNVYLAGDANADGKVNILDAVLIGLTWDDECKDPTACCELLWADEMADKADLNNDCKINILDAVIVGTMWDHNAYYPV